MAAAHYMQKRQRFFRLFSIGMVFLVMAGVSCIPKGAPIASTVVTIGFDDGVADQYNARAILSAHAMHAIFYINSGLVGNSGYMTWAQLADLFADGNEIGGHGLNHKNMRTLSSSDAHFEICTDRVNLFNKGFTPVSFAYPYGLNNKKAIQSVKDCGYNNARIVVGGPDTIPPHDLYTTQTMNAVGKNTSLADIEGWVTQTEKAGGGWVQLVFHHVCDSCDDYSISPVDFNALLDWLKPRSANGTAVKTVNEVIGGAVKPLVTPAP